MSAATIARIGIGMHEIDAMAHFYGDILGLPIHRHDLGFALNAGSVGVGFFQVSGPRGPLRSATGFLSNPTGMDHLVFAVSDLSVARKRLEDAGVEIDINDPLASSDDRAAKRLTLVRFQDPEGNLIGLTGG